MSKSQHSSDSEDTEEKSLSLTENHKGSTAFPMKKFTIYSWNIDKRAALTTSLPGYPVN